MLWLLKRSNVERVFSYFMSIFISYTIIVRYIICVDLYFIYKPNDGKKRPLNYRRNQRTAGIHTSVVQCHSVMVFYF